ncbi:hypothetical protein IV56_GL001356 [Lacticaseibacillus saniviri JCM 17471 = DSM 24301]|uniref:Uncharacterized protein n=2 Tax=Lacticaseibacillus saniviri TaxID=931533 RepID=A0A0R2MXH0_9LACO|nr:hypothetical protein [Lacticaseibacillus saniviri]KRO18225.1 hypothetical protein IV56_GL001356 [Lacticaseibacillus saniviri JCM 17471 = DSM 24301]MCG4282732.1 hypothetical protein [Lacticaseibacillus saniviri]
MMIMEGWRLAMPRYSVSEEWLNFKNKVATLIGSNDFDAVLKLRDQVSDSELEHAIDELASEKKDFSYYLFLEYWILKTDSQEAHRAAATALIGFYSWIPGAYTLAFAHIQHVIERDPNNIADLLAALHTWESPDAEVDQATVHLYAQRVLEVDPDNETALYALERTHG